LTFLFMLYLQQEQVAHNLNPQALTSLALLIGESAPGSKDLKVRLILTLLATDGLKPDLVGLSRQTPASRAISG